MKLGIHCVKTYWIRGFTGSCRRSPAGNNLVAMTSQPTPPLLAGHVLKISFATFTPQITIHSERHLTVEIIAGEGTGFSDTVEYRAVAVRDDLVVLSWQEHIGSTVVHVLDLSSSRAYTAVTPAKGGFMRLTGRVEVKSET
jgi:hypothetical protein